jgi:ribosomal protein S21
MYSDQVYKKKVSRAGVVRETDNYILYEDVDEIEKYRKMQAQKQQILRAEPRTKPPKDLLDNYRYYEDMRLRDPRKKGEVKYRRNSKPKGRETPFNRDSFKKFTNFSPNPRSSSHERKGVYHKKNDSKTITIFENQTNYVPRRNETLRSRPSDVYTSSGYGSRYNYKQNDVLEKRRPEDTYSTGKHGKHCIIRQLRCSPQKYHVTKPSYLRGGRKDSFDSYMKPYTSVYDDSDFNYQYKESVNIKRPKRRDSKTYHIRRHERSYSGGRSRFDGGFNSYNDYY